MKELGRILINPFECLTDRALWITGLLAYFLASVQVYAFVYVPDGVFQAHPTERVHWYSGLVNGALNILVPGIVLYVFGKIVYTKTRLLDVLNVMMIAQMVNYFIAFLLFNPFSKSKVLIVSKAIQQGDFKLETVSAMDIAIPSIGGVLALALLLYFFYLLIVGIRIAVNSKKTWHGAAIVLLVLLCDAVLHFGKLYV